MVPSGHIRLSQQCLLYTSTPHHPPVFSSPSCVLVAATGELYSRLRQEPPCHRVEPSIEPAEEVVEASAKPMEEALDGGAGRGEGVREGGDGIIVVVGGHGEGSIASASAASEETEKRCDQRNTMASPATLTAAPCGPACFPNAPLLAFADED